MSKLVKPSNPEFARLKEAAFDLLQWSLDDISPSEDKRIHLEMGIEREGHFIPPKMKRLWHYERDDWIDKKTGLLEELADDLTSRLPKAGGKNLERIYLDKSGTFHLEMTTTPQAPKVAAQSAIRNSNAMVDLAEEEGVKARFGTMKIPFITGHEKDAQRLFVDYHGEVFESDTDSSPLLAGQAQHVNVSVWCGDKNLCHHSPYKEDGGNTLGNAMAAESIRMLPGMMLPSRKNNYLRIAAEAELSVQTIGIKRNVKDYALNWVDKVDPASQHADISDYVRLEFRQASADANPMDAALAAAIPVTKACLTSFKRTNDAKGKSSIEMKKGLPQMVQNSIDMPAQSKMPHSHEEAAALFNTKDNPNFVFLNELAERKIKQCQDRFDQSGSSTDRLALTEAKKLEHIGSKLHGHYCRQYGLNSVMEQQLPKAKRMQ